MIIEFITWMNQQTFPFSQALPEVYENEAYNGSDHIYLTSPLRYKKKVSVVRQNEGPMLVQGNNWREFVEENCNENVPLLYFIEEGEDNFYVTAYYENGSEVIGYDDLDIRNKRQRFMSCVWPLPVTGIWCRIPNTSSSKQHVRIKGDGLRFDVQFTLVPIQVEEGGHGYELNEDTWDTIVQELDLEVGMIVVYTKKRANKMWLTAFHIDGTPATVVNFRGALPFSADHLDNIMKHRYQWCWHMDHFEEDFDTFYKPYAEIKARERLAIPADFLGIHPIPIYTKVLMRYNGYEQMMKVQMVYHYENPERANHVNVFGRWRLLARVNGFAYQKLIRFWYIYEVENLDAEDEADRRYPVFHLC
uniref:Uncharacterized protein n=1 Tax=Tanacetum cinerariifolium TaxID=118510 RepID=A0A699HCZ4_TANCI|nr:hypothetical protein [Tanacetum cinerariifolium]